MNDKLRMLLEVHRLRRQEDDNCRKRNLKAMVESRKRDLEDCSHRLVNATLAMGLIFVILVVLSLGYYSNVSGMR